MDIQLANLCDELTACGATLPPRLAAVCETARVIQSARTESIADQLRADLDDGTITPTNVLQKLEDAALRRSITAGARELARELEHPSDRIARRELNAHGDDLVTQLRTPWDTAAAVVTRAASLFPAGASAEDVLTRGPDAQSAWVELDEARATLDRVGNARYSLAILGRYGPKAPRVLMYLTDVSNGATLADATRLWDTSDQRRPGGRWHALAAAGHRLHLATAVEMEAASAAVQAADAATRAAEADRVRAARAKQLRPLADAWQARVGKAG